MGVATLGVRDEDVPCPTPTGLQKDVSKEIVGAHLAWLCQVGQKFFMLQMPIEVKQLP